MMDIAALSSVVSTQNVKQQTNVALMKKVIDVATTKADDIIKIAEQQPTGNAIKATPELGKHVDVRV